MSPASYDVFAFLAVLSTVVTIFQACGILRPLDTGVVKGVAPEQYTTAERVALSAVPSGTVVYDTDVESLFVYTTEWQQLQTSSSTVPESYNTSARLALSSPETGLVVYDTDVSALYTYTSEWVRMHETTTHPYWHGELRYDNKINGNGDLRIYGWTTLSSRGDWVTAANSSSQVFQVPREGYYSVSWDVSRTSSTNSMDIWVQADNESSTANTKRYGFLNVLPSGGSNKMATTAVVRLELNGYIALWIRTGTTTDVPSNAFESNVCDAVISFVRDL